VIAGAGGPCIVVAAYLAEVTMACRATGRAATIVAMATAFGIVTSPANADESVLAKFLGRWDVRVKTLQPRKPDVTYVETYERVLRRKFVWATD
jgi:hypothetical protein